MDKDNSISTDNNADLDSNSNAVLDIENSVVTMKECPKCGQVKEMSSKNPHICRDCEKAESNRYSYIRKRNDDWIANAEESGLDVWLQQPDETQWEYTVWCAYRDSYPGKKPSYAGVAKQLLTTYDAVRMVAQRWSFPVRMQAWMAECDRITLAQRRQEVLDMNKDHIDMAQRLRDKISKAIDLVDPTTLKPSEIGSLMRTAAELERKARVDEMAQEEMGRDLAKGTDNPNLKNSQTNIDDLGEVVKILMNAGALGNATQIGVRQTTEIIAKEE